MTSIALNILGSPKQSERTNSTPFRANNPFEMPFSMVVGTTEQSCSEEETVQKRMPSSIKALAIAAAKAFVALAGAVVAADGKIKIAMLNTQPIQQKWDARLHQALTNAQDRGDIKYVFLQPVFER
ncbi:MAG: hypothetical protein OXB95_05810 [Rhodobacteraceae bacterium]|nr:hypothetical protein [Paracoccaceae bacterium]